MILTQGLIGISEITNPYINIVAMLVESYALESMWILVTMILEVIAHPLASFFGNCQSYIEVSKYIIITKDINQISCM